MSDRILVTGGAGFIGANLVRALLARGDEVVVLDSGVAAGLGSVQASGAEIFHADVREADQLQRALSGCSGVVHLAAQTEVPRSIAEPIEDFETNVAASLALLEGVRRHGIARFVFASSNAVIGGHPPPAIETLVPRPVSPYGSAKAAVEAYLAAYHAAFGIECVALRFANAYGPWSALKTSVVAAFTRAYLDGGPLHIRGGGEQTRDFVHVDDINAAILACLDAQPEAIAGEVFQIGTGQETSLLQLAATLFDVGGHEIAIEHGPPSAGDIPRNVSDISKARRVLGYAPQVNLREGLAGTLEWFRGQRRA